MNQNVSVTNRARFATFAISIADSLCLLQQYKLNTIKILLPRLINNPPNGSNFIIVLDFPLDAGRCREVVILAFEDYARLVAVAECREVAVVERFKHEAIMYGL